MPRSARPPARITSTLGVHACGIATASRHGPLTASPPPGVAPPHPRGGVEQVADLRSTHRSRHHRSSQDPSRLQGVPARRQHSSMPARLARPARARRRERGGLHDPHATVRHADPHARPRGSGVECDACARCATWRTTASGCNPRSSDRPPSTTRARDERCRWR